MVNDRSRCVSAVLATYNRCPYDPASLDARRNPLRWCLDTLIASRACPLREIIVVNDASTDFTAAFLQRYNAGKIPLKILTLSRQHGSGPARTIGVRHATSPFCLLCDDDAVPAPHALTAGTKLFLTIRATHPRAAVLQFPVYLRVAHPTLILAQKRIGRCVPLYGIIESNFHSMPAEYLHSPPRSVQGLLAPFRITNLIGVFLVERAAFLTARGLPTLPWRNGSSEGTEFALRLASVGYTLWFSPDPRLHFCHLRYGAPERPSNDPPDDYRYEPYALQELVRESACLRIGTGNRFPEEDAYQLKIMSRFVIVGIRSRHGALLWALRAFVNFVVLNNAEFTGSIIAVKIRRFGIRLRLWILAVYYGIIHLRHGTPALFFNNKEI